MLIVEKRMIAVLACIVVCAAIIGAAAGIYSASSPSAMPVIVIDAGHGGIDAGVYGVNTGVRESDINLAVARELKGCFADAGFECVMTRTTQAGLYGNTSKGFKMRDMQKRRQIIEDSGADMVISIHQNTCPLPSRRGSHVFYDEASGEGRELALSIQSRLNGLWNAGENSALAGDYYMLKCTSAPSVIVECGFLSNAEDEENLNDPDFRRRLAKAIFMGAITYLS